MALNQLFLPAVQREIIREIPDERILPYGGPFGVIIPDQDRRHNELLEIDTQTPTAANLVALGATNVRATRGVNNITMDRAIQIVRHEELTQEDMEWLDSIAPALGANPALQSRVLDLGRRIQEDNLKGIQITRGYLLASMAVGEISWDYLGFKYGSTSFSMPAEMKLTPAVYWRTSGGSTNTNATPVSNIAALDRQVSDVWGLPKFDVIGMSYQAFLAMIATTEYQNQAKAVTAMNLVTSLPVAGTPAAFDLAGRVLGKEIRITDQTFDIEGTDGERTSVRYVPERLATLWRKADENRSDRWEFGNVPVTKSMLAAIGGNSAFGGTVQRGPIGWGAVESQQFTSAALLAVQEGMPRRKSRGVTAVIETRGGA